MDEYGRQEPKDIRVAQCERLSRVEWDAMPDYARANLERVMRESIAHFIQGVKVPLKVDEFYVERRLDLYVATPDEFWGIVHREAERLAMRYAPRRIEG